MILKENRSRTQRWMISQTLIVLATLIGSAYCQTAPSVRVGRVEITGIPDDWTHHHIFFSNAGSEQDAIQTGRHDQWQKVVNEPRYVIQQLKKNLPVVGPAAVDAAYRARWIADADAVTNPHRAEPERELKPLSARPAPIKRRPTPPANVKRDWSMTSGGNGGLVTGHYPAKYQFLSYSTSVESCTDYVAFPTGITGSSTQATLVAYNNIYKAPTCSGGVPNVLLSINTGGLANTSPVLSLDGSEVAFMQTTPTVTVTGTVTRRSTTFTVSTGTLTAALVGATISGTNIPAGDTIASVTNATTGTLTTQATANGTNEALTIAGWAQLVLVKIGPGGGTAVSSPLSPTATTNANYRACTAPCYTALSLNGYPTDSNSAPFYVYPSSAGGSPDILYVGDDDGNVHKFTNVFLTGTPAELINTGWPVSASTQAIPGLNSPIYDSVSGYIFVGDASGYLHQFTPGTNPGAVSNSGRLAYNTGGLLDPPLIDSGSGTDLVYQFVGYSNDTTHNRPSYINLFAATGTNSIAGGSSFGSSVYFPNGSTSLRPAGTNTLMNAGTFDNTYFTGAGNTGNIYACSDGVVYQIPLATIATPTVNAFSAPTLTAATCSPVTEFYNSGSNTDYLFVSVASSGVLLGGSTCLGACLLKYNAPASSATHTGLPTAGLGAPGGTSGIIVDNSGPGGGSQIYFTSVGDESCTGVNGVGSTGYGTGSCAVQVTQSGLQ